ncbi:unnamed protein product [Auanema sp. JU1783]|nr:unnamed protein product [Auanema sp. JU1783]
MNEEKDKNIDEDIEEESEVEEVELSGSDASGSDDEEDVDEAEGESSDSSDEDEEENESDGTTESDTDDSVWSEFEGGKEETQEAYEAIALQMFQEGLHYVVNNKPIRAKKIFNELLRNPLVSVQEKNTETFEAEDDRVSKMTRIFVGVHKNLAVLENDTEKAIHHYIEVLSVTPNNPSIWRDLAVLLIQLGNLDFALYAVERASGEDVFEMRLSILFLARQFHACLEMIKEASDADTMNNLMTYIKEKIRGISEHYREVCDDLFGENRRYQASTSLSTEIQLELQKRIETAQSKVDSVLDFEIPIESYEVIEIDIEAEYDLPHILTIFCDLFDRIESYTSPSLQTITFRSWGERLYYIEAERAINDIQTIIEVVDDMIKKIESPTFALMKAEEKQAKAPASVNNGMFVRRSVRKVETFDVTEPDESEDENLPNKLADHLDVKMQSKILGFRTTNSRTRSPSPIMDCKSFDADAFADSLKQTLFSGTWTICEILECVLLELTKHTPAKGNIPKCLYEPIAQIYRRMHFIRSNMEGKKWIALHMLMFEIGEYRGQDYCVRHHFKNGWEKVHLAVRFAWNFVSVITNEKTQLKYLLEAKNCLDENSQILTASGILYKDDFTRKLDAIEKVDRVKSIEELRAANLHEQVVSIISKDIDFNVVSEEEMDIILSYWLEGLIFVKNFEDACKVSLRYLHHICSGEEKSLTRASRVFEFIEKFDLSGVSNETLNSLAFYFCQMLVEFSKYWPLWRALHKTVKVLDGGFSFSYINSLNPDVDFMPSRALDVLSKAHETLGSERVCGDHNGAFLGYYFEELNELVRNEEIVNHLLLKENFWIWSNINEEIAQCLQCAFGRFCKKRKAVSDHESRGTFMPSKKQADVILNLAMPLPMPMFDDKERLGHDIVELLQSKFANHITVSQARNNYIDTFRSWLKTTYNGYNVREEPEWPVAQESELQSRIWFVMALHNYRQNNNAETITYCSLFFTSSAVKMTSSYMVSAWAMLGHFCVCDLFQLSNDEMIYQLDWLTMPYRFAIQMDGTMAVLHFQHANCLYQVATRLERFLDTLADDDIRKKRVPYVRKLRSESLHHFEEALALAKPPSGSLVEEFHWLCYFFMAKLHAKEETCDVLKIADYLFEAACSCQLGDYYYYPLKINVKKQQNVEPIELHYQVHSVAFKYISNTEDPPMETLVTLISYLRAFQRHKVVKNNYSLFSCHPEIEEVGLNLTLQVEQSLKTHETDIDELMDDLVSKASLIQEIWDMCLTGFEIVCERFPHPKAHYRLAQMELSRHNTDKCLEHLFKGIYRRKKRENLFFENVVLITSSDIDRSGSFTFHFDRWLRLTVSMCVKIKDLGTLMNILTAVANEIGCEEEDRIPYTSHTSICNYCIKAIATVINKDRIQSVKADIYRLWSMLEKHKRKLIIMHTQKVFGKIIEKHYGDIDKIVKDPMLSIDSKRRPYKKRKNVDDTGCMVPAKQGCSSATEGHDGGESSIQRPKEPVVRPVQPPTAASCAQLQEALIFIKLAMERGIRF